MSAALLFGAKVAADSVMGFVSYMSEKSTAKANARIQAANAFSQYAAAQYNIALEKRDAAEQYARELAAANNAFGAAGVAANSGTADMTAQSLFEGYRREIDTIGVRKSFADLEYGSTVSMAKAKKKGEIAGAGLNFVAGVVGGAMNTATSISKASNEG